MKDNMVLTMVKITVLSLVIGNVAMLYTALAERFVGGSSSGAVGGLVTILAFGLMSVFKLHGKRITALEKRLTEPTKPAPTPPSTES